MFNKFHRSRRRRPDIQEAKDFIKNGYGGGMGKSDYVTFEERKERIEKLSAEIKEKIKKHIPRSTNLDLVILKCHLLLEFIIEEFIDLMAPTEGVIKNERFTFKQKESVAHMLGFPSDPLFFPTIDLLNKVRNQVAHTLEINRDLIDEIIRINAEDPDEIGELTDKERARELKSITKFMCFQTLGIIKGLHAIYYINKVEQNA